METKEMKYTLFDMAKYYIESAEYMLRIGNSDKSLEMSYKYDALMGVIESLSLTDEYEYFVETGELK